MNRYLEPGKYTPHDEVADGIARKIKQVAFIEGLSVLEASRRFLDKEVETPLYKSRRETFPENANSSMILSSKKAVGCRQRALAIIPCLRLNGIPVAYRETLLDDWIDNPDLDRIRGHVFIDVYYEGSWRTFEPLNGFTKDNRFVLNGRRYVPIGTGNDHGNIGIIGLQEVFDLTDLKAFLPSWLELTKQRRKTEDGTTA